MVFFRAKGGEFPQGGHGNRFTTPVTILPHRKKPMWKYVLGIGRIFPRISRGIRSETQCIRRRLIYLLKGPHQLISAPKPGFGTDFDPPKRVDFRFSLHNFIKLYNYYRRYNFYKSYNINI